MLWFCSPTPSEWCCGSLCRVSLTSLWTICTQSLLFSGGSRTISQTGATAALSPQMLVAQNGTGILMPSQPWRLCQGGQVTIRKSSSKHLIHSVKVSGCRSQPWQSHTKGSQGASAYLMNTKLTSTYSLSHPRRNMNNVNQNVNEEDIKQKTVEHMQSAACQAFWQCLQCSVTLPGQFDGCRWLTSVQSSKGLHFVS